MWGFILRIFASIVLTGISAWLSYRKQEQPQPGTLDDFGNPRAEEGTEIAKIFGTVNIADPNVVWFGDYRTDAIVKTAGRRYGLFGPKNRQTIGFMYYLGIHFVLCLGAIDRITRIRVDKRVAWEGASSGGLIEISQPNLFGSSEREGGVFGGVEVRLGGPAQAVSGYLGSRQSAPVPAYRGVASAVLQQVYLGNSPSLRPWDFKVERINSVDPGYNGGAQWYPEKAAIPNSSLVTSENYSFSLTGGDIPPADRFTSTVIAGNYGYVLDVSPGDTVQIFPVAPSSGFNTAMDPQQDGTWRWILGIIFNDDQFDIATWNPTGSGTYATPGAALAVAAAAGPYTMTGKSRYRFVVNLEASVFVIPPEAGGLTANIVVSRGSADMNPAHILREILLSPDCGGTGVDADADDTWEAAADTLFDEGFGLSIAWRGGADRADFKREIERHIDGRAFIDRRTGKWSIKLIRDDYDPETLPVFDSANVASWSNIAFPQPGSLLNQLVVTWTDPTKEEKTSLTISNPARIRMNGSQIVQEKVEYPGIQRADLAGRVAARDLAARSAPLVTGEFVTKNLPSDLNIGSAIIVDNPRLGLINKIVRITEIEDGNIRDSSARVKFIEDRFAVGDESPIEIEIPTPEVIEPEPVFPRQVEEAPYALLVDRLGAPNAAAVLTDDADSGFLFVAGAEPSAFTSEALIQRDQGGGYQEIDQMTFVPGAVTLGAMSRVATETKVVVESADDLTALAVGSLAWLDGEQVTVTLVEAGDTSAPGDYWEPTEAATTGLTVYTVTFKRGCLDTVPAVHAAGAGVVFYGVLGSFEDDIQTATDEIDVKLQSVTPRGVLALADAPVDSITFASRAIRPNAPGQFKLNGSYEDQLTDVFVLTWVHRNRLTETAAAPVGHNDAGVTSEPDVTYRVTGEAFTSGGVSISTFIDTNVGALLTYEWDGISPALPVNATRIRFAATSVRDGYESWQSPFIDVEIGPGARAIEDADDDRATEDPSNEIRTTEA